MASPAFASTVLDRLLHERFSCRGFRSDPLPEATIRRMFAMAQKAASWCNTQPWQVLVTTGAATERFAAHLTSHAAASPPRPDLDIPERYVGVYDARRKVSGYALYASLGIAREDRAARAEQAAKNLTFFGAPHVAVITTDRNQGTYGAIDCGGYVANLLLAARSLGVATVAQAAIAMYSDAVREHFGLPEDRAVVCAVSFGFADEQHPANAFRTERATVDEAVEIRHE